MSRQSRRDFLKKAAAGGLTAAAFTVAGTSAFGQVLGTKHRVRRHGRVLGANDRVRIAVVGVNQRGLEHIQCYCKMKDNVEIAYLVDPDSRLFEKRGKYVQDNAGDKPKCVQDLRKALDDKNLDAISIASPNHWHALQAIWACQAGKDVYVEKPCSHNVWEGRKLVEAARRYDCIVQQGSQNRSNTNWINTLAAVRGGKYGKLLVAYGFAGKRRLGIGFKQPKTPPTELDYDIWLGPAPKQPYHENLVHYNWHWFWDFGSGEIGNQGSHQMDLARWAMPDGAVPRSVISLGGRYKWEDQGQTPNTQLTIIDFGGPQILFEDRDIVPDMAKTSVRTTVEYYLEEGVIKGGKFFPKGKGEGEPLPGVVADEIQRPVTISGKQIRRTPDPAAVDAQQLHFVNFIDCVRSRKRENLNTDILVGHLSTRLCHLANISYRLGAEVPFSKETKAFGDNKAANDAFESMKEYLGGEVKLKLEDANYRLGRQLNFDDKTEKFVGDDEANKLLTRTYREGYVVPESV